MRKSALGLKPIPDGADRPTMRRGKCPRWPEDWIYKDYCERCQEHSRCKGNDGGKFAPGRALLKVVK